MADPVTIGAAVGWGMKAAGWIVSPIVSNLISKGFSYLSFDTSEKLRQLEIKVIQLELMLGLEAVQIYPHRNRLEPLLKNLKSAFYEAEDVLDDVEYHRLERQIRSHRCRRNWVRKMQSTLPSCSFLKNQDSGNMSDEAFPCISRDKLKKSIDKLENIINEAHRLLSLLNLPDHSHVDKRQIINANSDSPVTTAAPPPVVIGREKDRDSIIAMLHKNVGDVKLESNSAISNSIIGIHGIPGSGKSTLAQLVCACEKKDKQDRKKCHFNLIMWIHVSQNFNIDKIFKEMLEEATGETCPEFKSLNTLEQKIEEVLSGKRFLLVLDDVWYKKGENQQQLEKLVFPLKAGKAGSKILVTSRTMDALIAVGAGSCIPISDLDDNDFLKLFMHYALEGANVDEPDRSKFKRIGADIAKKLRRSPLAARTVGGQLRMRVNVEFWTYARNRDLLNDTMGALWWSYQQLDEQVRRCFSYCSIFSRRQQLERDYLVTMWVAQGFIKTTDAGEDLEDVGNRYFDELVSCSFLKKHMRLFGCKDYFTVHDLLHDLAEKVLGNDCFRIQKDWAGDLPRGVRHLTIETYDKTMITERIPKLETLRTLIIYMNNTGMVPDKVVLESIFTRMRKLRVLRVQSIKLGPEQDNIFVSLPASIGKLKHLRYFGYMSGYVHKLVLPSTITKLHHLQVLEFDSCGDLVFSSDEDLSKLTSLRHVMVLSFCPFSIRHLGRLASLQAAPHIEVKKEVGYEIEQLEHLNKLQGKLHISGLENVESKEAAVQANLAAKERLKELVLEWDDEKLRFDWDQNSNAKVLQAEVLEGLCPPADLEVLHIRGYSGPRYPSWLVGQQNSPKNLQKLELSSSTRLGSIPEHSELFGHLRSLRISNCRWQSLPDNMEHLTSLKELTLLYCSKFMLLPTLPRSLENFQVISCNEVLMSSCQTTGHPNWRTIKHIPHKEISMF